MIRQVSSTPSWRVKRTVCPTIAAWSSTSYGVAPSPPAWANSTSSMIGATRLVESARWASSWIRTPVEGSSLITSWFGSGRRSSTSKPSFGGCLKTRRTSVCVTGRRLPARMKNGTPDQRQFSMFEPQRGERLGGRVGGHPVDREVAVVLAADVARRIGGLDRAVERDLGLLERVHVATGGRLHRGRADDLHEVVHDHVAQRAHRVVEVPAVLHAEVLCHRDLDALDVVPVPDRLEHRVREAEEEDLLEAHLPEVVVDAEDLRLVDVLVEVLSQLARRGEVVSEGLLHDDARAVGQTRLGEPLHDGAEEEGRDLEVEDGGPGAGDRGADPRVHRGVREVAGHVRQTGGEALEHLLVDRLARPLDRRARALDEVVDRPVVDRHADDRAVEQATPLEPVQRAERHHLRKIAGDPEHDEHVRRTLIRDPCPARRLCCLRRGHVPTSFSLVVIDPHADACRTLVREPGPGPVDDRLRPVLSRGEQREMHGPPRERRLLPGHREAVRPLHDRGEATDRRHRALVEVVERLGLLALQEPGDVLACPLAGLQRHAAELRERRLLPGRDPGDVADREDLGVTFDAEIGPGRDPSAPLELDSECLGQRVRVQPRAPHERVGGDRLTRRERDPGRGDGLHDLADHHLDAELVELLERVPAQLRLEHREDLRARLDEHDAHLLVRDVRVVLDEETPVELGDRACALDSGRAAPDDHDVQGAVVDERRVLVGRLPAFEDVLPQTERIRERVERERVLGGSVDSEELDPGAERDDEVVVAERRHLGEAHLPRLGIDAGHRRGVHPGVRLLVEEVAERMADRGLRQQVGRHLVEERLERVVVVRVDEHDLGVRFLERPRRADPGEPAAQDQHARARPPGVGRLFDAALGVHGVASSEVSSAW